MSVTLKDDGCPVCGSQDRHQLGRAGKRNTVFERFGRDIEQVNTVRCRNCTALYIAPMVHFSDSLQAQLYNIEYFASADGVRDQKNMREKESILDILERVTRPLTGRSLLDIGCGTGEYLVAASKRGMSVTGIDVEASLAEHIQRKYGLRVMTGSFGDDTVPPGSFDVIVLSHVIEHLQEPVPLLGSIHRALKPTGIFIMATPNFDSLLESLKDLYGRLRYDRARSYFLTPFTSPYHVLGFNVTSARHILEKTGFTPIYLKVFSGLEWDDDSRKLAMRTIKVLGALVRRGMNLVTISRKQESITALTAKLEP